MRDGTSQEDALILVDEADREIGYLGKAQCHRGGGVLHRAFSLLVFNPQGELLLQQRSAAKRLWPLYWSNSCCSHPRRAESMQTAIHRRLYEELGLACPLRFLFKFRYRAQFDADGAENELCSVYAGCSAGAVRAAPEEILSWRWVGIEALEAELRAHPERFTPWFRLEWQRIAREHCADLEALRAQPLAS